MSAATPKPGLRRRFARFAAIVIGLVVALVVVEVAVRITLKLRGEPFDSGASSRRIATLRSSLLDAAPRVQAIPREELNAARSQGQILHPYFGWDFVGYHETLATELEYYRGAEADETYDVMILGGSVAMNLVPEGVEALTAALRTDPKLADRKIQVLGHGRAAQKAPQQTMVLQFLLCAGAKPDAVIALDGFNEVAVALQNARQGIAVVYPCASIWVALAGGAAGDPQVLERALDVRQRQLAVVDATEQFARWNLGRLASTAWLATQRIDRLRNAAGAAAGDFERTVAASRTFDTFAGPKETLDDAAQIERCVGLWRENARSLHALCAARGIDFLDVLQPAAIYAGSKPLSDEERPVATAIDAWQTAVDLGYPRLREVGKTLANDGIAFHDATQIFVDTTETVYIDSCHVNAHGYDVLARSIGNAFVAARARGEKR
ncbi:MAG: hypothetical protein K8S98_08325 [Planctomycetes bacterium]|nr:hypothetical protein [Planctomycetota bacterium]